MKNSIEDVMQKLLDLIADCAERKQPHDANLAVQAYGGLVAQKQYLDYHSNAKPSSDKAVAPATPEPVTKAVK